MSKQAAKAKQEVLIPQPANDFEPYITSEKSIPEITIKATLLGIFLSMLMAGSNAYLGLKVGLTVSACIPAAVISMACLRLFRTSNILENNIVQTAASAGEVIASAVAFTLPALIMMGYWSGFPYYLTTAILIIGGLLGVLFSIPLRRAFVCGKEALKFPEGIATAEVLKVGDKAAKGGAQDMVAGGLAAAFIKFAQSGLMIFSEGAHHWVATTRTVFGFGTGLSLVLVGAGYIVGLQVGVSMMVGGVIAWVIGVPLHGYLFGLPEGKGAYEAAVTIWNSNIRMIGVGTMVVGGIWTLAYLIKPISDGIKASFASLREARLGQSAKVARTELDVPMTYVIMGIGALTVPLFFIFNYVLDGSILALTPALYWSTIVGVTIFAIVVGFICAAIAGYMTGIIGSSNCPISGVTIMAILSISLMLLVFLGSQIDFANDQAKALAAAALTIIIGSVMCSAAAIGSDNLQDLKSGHIVGATPWKQQVMLMVGVIAGSLVMAPIVQILYEAYGIGNVMPRAGMDPAQTLGAPKAAIMAAVSQGIFTRSLDWTMFGLGALIAVAVIVADSILKAKKTGWSIPVLAVALGIYMPLDVTVPLLIGGIIAALSNKALAKKKPGEVETAQRRGLLFSSGLIAGEALVGIALAVPFAAYQTTEIFKIAPEGFYGMSTLLGSLAFSGVAYYLYKIASRGLAK